MKIYRNYPLSSHNTLGLRSIAAEYAKPTNLDQLLEALECSEPITILGGGSNVILATRIQGRVIQYTNDSIRAEQISDGRFRVTATASVEWHELVRYTLGRGIPGLENLSLIPGSVGAAPYQNIGAYGRELSEVLESVTVLDLRDLEKKVLSREQCKFGYRSSAFKDVLKNRYLILEITLVLGATWVDVSYRDLSKLARSTHDKRLTPTQIAEYVIKIRRQKLPDQRRIGNVGSFFKNPIVSKDHYERTCERYVVQGLDSGDGRVKLSAAQLIDLCGWRGYRKDSVGVWQRQPLVLVNYGGARIDQILDLAKFICEDVYYRFSIHLEREPVLVQ